MSSLTRNGFFSDAFVDFEKVTGLLCKSDTALDIDSRAPFPCLRQADIHQHLKNEISAMVVNGKYLFAIDGINFSSVDSYLMESNGALKKVARKTFAPRALGFPLAYLFLDHTGATLYPGVYINDNPVYPQYQSFNIEKGTDELNYTGQILGTPSTNHEWEQPLRLWAAV
jgi:hypothetical protein